MENIVIEQRDKTRFFLVLPLRFSDYQEFYGKNFSVFLKKRRISNTFVPPKSPKIKSYQLRPQWKQLGAEC